MEACRQWGCLTRQPSLGLLLGFLLFCCMQKIVCPSTDTIYPTQSLTGNKTITSSGGIFELGYFTLGNPTRYYIGIWYKDIPVDNVVWVANRDRPLYDNTAEFTISKDGNLVLQTQSGSSVIWSTNLNPSPRSNSMVAILLDSGNLVLRDKNSSAGTIIWDAFSHPTDTWLPNQIFGLNKAIKQIIGFSAWKNLQDPSPGFYSDEVDPNGTAQIILLWNKTQQYWSTGTWDGHVFSAVPEMRGRPINFSYVTNDTVSYFTYSFYSTTIIARFILDHTGQVKLFIWDKNRSQWILFWVRPTEYLTCEVYGLCGAFGVCDQVSLNPCQCVDGFKPVSAKNWELNDWTDGCARKNKLQCAGDQFSLLSNMRAPGKPDVARALGSAAECKSVCLKDCSCTAYSYVENNCSIWRGDLFNLQLLSEGSGDGIYIRLAGSQTATNETAKKQPAPVITEASTGGEPIDAHLAAAIGLGEKGECNRGPDLPLYDLRAIMVATNNFFGSNRLGEGGFGAVYKGELSGEQVAVKRLSKDSKQGVEEFVNEVKLIAKLQHKNLVQLLGCCVEGDEKILVYEYMPNKSLDTFIFGEESLRRLLGWEKRFGIVMGIARGLQYLHRESRLRVIHRDLKGSNILLDGEMNPKISDFGLARIFDGDQSQVNTHRVVGTYGYMPPEYALEGRYSIKTDVFSFGVIVLEIVSGQRMTRFQDMEHSLNLLGHAWKLWNEDKAVNLLDPLLGTPCNVDQVMKCINVGLLCVQEDATDRPTMASICLMLSEDAEVLPTPKHPAYSHKARPVDASSPPIGSEPTTTPISAVEARGTIYPTEALRGDQTITSPGGAFELGYFTLGNPARYYVGVWFKHKPGDNVVWEANRGRPLQDNTAEFKISEDGNLVLQTRSGSSVIWSTNLNPSPRSSFTVAVLLEQHLHRLAIDMEACSLTRKPSLTVLFGFLLCCFVQKILCSSMNTIYPTHALMGDQTITSSGGAFELGYFTLGNPARYYIGVWFKDKLGDDVVWVANRKRPLQDNTAELKISEDGNLNPSPRSSSMVAVLLDSGNLVLRDKSSTGTIFWDSFSHPSNTWLPRQVFGLNKVTKQRHVLTSWKNLQDPSPGPFSYGIDPDGTAQCFLLWNRTHKYWSTGIWDGHIFANVPEMRGYSAITFNYVTNDTVSYFTYAFYGSMSRFIMDHTGQLKLYIWDKDRSRWTLLWLKPTEYLTCEVYGLCGAFGVCDQVSLNPCQCVEGFTPASAKNWELNDWSDGCTRKSKLQCADDQFSLLPNMRAPGKPDASTALGSADECKSACLKDCSCTAYSYKESNCSIWRGDLFNLQHLPEGSGDGIYIRLAGLQTTTNETAKKQPAPVITDASTGGEPSDAHLAAAIGLGEEGECNRGPDLPLYELRAIMVATNNFSESNRLGEGGFGAVYKGDLSGEQVAVKRLSKDSKQGVEEFVNEVKLIAKLQHKNLVQLLGCCVEGDEKILVYEYMPNKSLDTFIFGEESLRRLLGWEKRFGIVMGIARGLQYLHRESRLRVIHRDLKGSNILLDGEMNPKISDFGLARIFDGDQSQVNTHRVVGTYGYMPPEYALEGRYSIKTDVFSFGVIVLEIVSGQRMTRFQDMEHSLNLLGHAWKLWNEDKAMDLLDSLLGTPCNLDQVMRCINVGLLCVQEDAADRPTMASICLMLSEDAAVLPAPKHPAYSHKRKPVDGSSPPTGSEPTTTLIPFLFSDLLLCFLQCHQRHLLPWKLEEKGMS
ncbi:G-type lectin S-receptor-like serine/threonine-protein kinase [Nymphaea thermarum]|nr:G-type lectin S-receptor-like serine/threonine-protein kinase [Nymphaea thermarum]